MFFLPEKWGQYTSSNVKSVILDEFINTSLQQAVCKTSTHPNMKYLGLPIIIEIGFEQFRYGSTNPI